MKLVTAEEMKRLDQLASSAYHVPSIVLMENAGLRVVEVISRHFQGKVRGKRIAIFAGKGNNGGDGLVVARHLMNAGAEVQVFMLARTEDLKGDAAANLQILQKMKARIYCITEERHLQRVDIVLLYTDLVVDAIFGTGFKGAAMGLPARVIQLINERGKPVVAVDLPSGLEADTGKVLGPCIQARYTVTFALPKLGLILEPGAQYVGELIVADISIPNSLIEGQPLKHNLITEEWCRSLLPRRKPWGHKGDFGHVFVIGGSPGMTGAVVLAGEAALRSGAGLVTVGVPRSLNPVIEEKLTEVMSKPLAETEGKVISVEALPQIEAFLEKVSVVAVGPGMSTDFAPVNMVRQLILRLSVPAVIDADGLNALAGKVDILKEAKVPLVITPHPGEMARLTGMAVDEVQDNRVHVARKAAEEWGVVVVLKGAKTVVASPSGEIFINPSGNVGMATGGSGDVLTGVISGLIAQGMQVLEAAVVGTFIHGKAGDEAVQEKGRMGLVAGDIIDRLPEVLKGMER
ncbi:NAD(P)H-hydrate dehydratase [Calderihabitans maritimus]|uniref:Bifunctional NAD(P)H-hydrate repair enzyme n=1 Tax=Calderihabitans maritimus TaxID=1246530 RepID=A0A1Z5HTC4_9FIRM|nr:NAD(P)H-hydrate dehydratase [Calderihabitans maritimus]GAW92520.1 hypothetical protein Moth_2168 [Calderihabitans maritimus]